VESHPLPAISPVFRECAIPDLALLLPPDNGALGSDFAAGMLTMIPPASAGSPGRKFQQYSGSVRAENLLAGLPGTATRQGDQVDWTASG
jgi:hypothetical protein